MLASRPECASSLNGQGFVRLYLGDLTAGEANLAAAREFAPTIYADTKRDGRSKELLAGALARDVPAAWLHATPRAHNSSGDAHRSPGQTRDPSHTQASCHERQLCCAPS